MKFDDCVLELMTIFKGSFINDQQELILEEKSNLFILIKDKDELAIKANIIEWCSRRADYNSKILKGLNLFLKTNFNNDDIHLVYKLLGNHIRPDLTIKFIKSNYDINLLIEVLEDES
ncbi:hypothetical protein ACVPPR_07345 [Dellaglioa sp. L3N]